MSEKGERLCFINRKRNGKNNKKRERERGEQENDTNKVIKYCRLVENYTRTR